MPGDLLAQKVFLIILAVVLILGMSVLIYIKADHIIKARYELETEKNGLKLDKERLSELKSLKANEDELKTNYEKARKLMPEEPDEAGLIKYLQQKAETAMMKVVQIEFGPREQADQYTDMPVKISFSGEYEALVKFLELIGDGERAVRIDSMNVSTAADGTDYVKADISAHCFYRSNDSEQEIAGFEQMNMQTR